jgi:hypothetical protein
MSLFFYPEDGGNNFLENFGKDEPYYTVPHSRR